MKDALPDFNRDSFPKVSVDHVSWERLDVTRACNGDDIYLNEHKEEALIFLKGNLKIGCLLLLEALKIANSLLTLNSYTIPDEILEFALQMGGGERSQALLHMYLTEKSPNSRFIPLLKAIISQSIENELDGKFHFRAQQVIRVLGRYNTPDTIEFLKRLPENELIGADDLVRQEVEKVLNA